jgi:signal transduction histidine kinase
MLKPIDNMTRTAKFISAGDLNTRLDVVDSHDELKELALTFNDMLNRIQTSFEQQNVFVSDASHELKTPIAVIQGYANMLKRWGKEDKEVLLESIDAIVGEAQYMQDLVEKLLFLASTDKKNQKMESGPVVLNELIEEVLKETNLIDTQHVIKNEINEVITVIGDRGLIKQALRVFISNSIKFTPAGGSITINSKLSSKKALISIADTGIGISADDLPYIFNRFYKSDKSRNRESGGAGLGLSIAKWIIDQHLGGIKVESAPGIGTKVMISLPILNQPIQANQH